MLNDFDEMISNQSSIIKKERKSIELNDNKEFRVNKKKSLYEHLNNDLFCYVDNYEMICFDQDKDIFFFKLNRDFQIEGVYESDSFVEIINSSRNNSQ